MNTLSSVFGPTQNIWVDRAHLLNQPQTGDAWDRLYSDAHDSWGSADVSDQNNQHDVHTLAGAIVAVATNDTELRDRVVESLEAAVGTEGNTRALALARQLTGYVIAADLIGYRSDRFVDWVDRMRSYPTSSGPSSLIDSHEDRPNNWGTHAGAARTAAAIYLEDTDDLDRAATVFRGLLGDRDAYAEFKYGNLDWQADQNNPVGVNPVGATIDGHNVDGALPEELRRAGGFSWPPPKENYCWEAMQGIVTQAWILHRRGLAVADWSDRAVLRATEWLWHVADYPATGDDSFAPYIIDAIYGTSYGAGDAGVGKSVGYTDWTHVGAPVVEPPAEEPPAEEPPVEEPPAEEPPAEEPPAEEPPVEDEIVYVHETVKAGDSLSLIAAKYGIRWDKIHRANPWIADPNVIPKGAVLHVPVKVTS